MDHLRLLLDQPAPGPWNMAVDEALLAAAAADGVATLRFYQWSEPTLSLGYFQAAAEREQHAASIACPLVRRASGGGAIVHDRELTYSIALPQSATRALAATALYDLFHQTLVQAFAEQGISAALFKPPADGRCATRAARPAPEPFLCFQRRTCGDIVCGPAKIVGSAQRRSRGAVLQHGSILLARSPAAPELPGILQLTGIPLAPDDFAGLWLAPLAARLKRSPERGELSPREQQQARQFVADRYAAADYLLRR